MNVLRIIFEIVLRRMIKVNSVDQKKILKKISEMRKKEREKFLKEINVYLKQTKSIVTNQPFQKKDE